MYQNKCIFCHLLFYTPNKRQIICDKCGQP